MSEEATDIIRSEISKLLRWQAATKRQIAQSGKVTDQLQKMQQVLKCRVGMKEMGSMGSVGSMGNVGQEDSGRLVS